MNNFESKKSLITRYLIFIVLTFQISPCTGQEKGNLLPFKQENGLIEPAPILNQTTTFPQIHTNLNGMVREFVRSMHQDTKRQNLVWHKWKWDYSLRWTKT